MKKYILTGRDMQINTKVYPYYCEEQLRMMTNDDISNRIILLEKKKDKFGVDVTALNKEMQELKREVEKRSNFNKDVLENVIRKTGKNIIVLDPKNGTSINPFEFESKNNSSNGIVDMKLIGRLGQGGFENLTEVLELVEKFHKSYDPITIGIFNEWWENDGSKKGLLKLIEKLKL
ncbi:hypothetical protein [Clostridium akagii]|uniref:hypothetical protein n=1 Tax=Clostridium akagii TaxID=91623 RepID=UPI00047E4B5A|nr:hypothetical protein [Clostridium akagii]